jgi:hypothetical protein
MIMEKRLALLITSVFGMGMGGGLLIGSVRTESQHIKTEYYLELRPRSILIEDINCNVITCPYDKISETLIKDNL